jgi:hypothetical protein
MPCLTVSIRYRAFGIRSRGAAPVVVRHFLADSRQRICQNHSRSHCKQHSTTIHALSPNSLDPGSIAGATLGTLYGKR